MFVVLIPLLKSSVEPLYRTQDTDNDQGIRIDGIDIQVIIQSTYHHPSSPSTRFKSNSLRVLRIALHRLTLHLPSANAIVDTNVSTTNVLIRCTKARVDLQAATSVAVIYLPPANDEPGIKLPREKRGNATELLSIV